MRQPAQVRSPEQIQSRISSVVAATPAETAEEALRHFTARLAFETDPADVAADLQAGAAMPYSILDVRGVASFERGHLPGARSCPSSSINAEVAAALPEGMLVVYCWGPGCNGAQKAAARLAAHGRQVKEMIGGFEYWVREGLPVEGDNAERLSGLADQDLVG